jgi:hypothetical protein
MSSLILVPLALALGLATSGASAQPPAPAAVDTTVAAAPVDSPAKAPADERAVIQFENQAWDLATIYLVPQFGLPIRLGQVTSGRTANLVVPRGVLSSARTVEIVAVPFASRRAISSGPVTLYQGEALRASLASSANLISVLPAR